MKNYSVPRQVWRALYIPIIYIGVQLIISFAVMFGFGIVYALEHAVGDDFEIDEAALTIAAEEFLEKSGVAIVLFSAAICFLIFFLIWNKERKALTAETVKLSPVSILIVLGLGVFSNYFLSGFMYMTNLTALFPSHEVIEMFATTGGLPLRIITIGLVVPIVEEIAFRGLLYNRLRRSLSVVPAILISSALFGVMHLNILQGIYTFFLGILFAYMYERYKKIWVPITAHVALNMATVISTAFTSPEAGNDVSTAASTAMFLIGLVATAALLWAWIIKTRKDESRS